MMMVGCDGVTLGSRGVCVAGGSRGKKYGKGLGGLDGTCYGK